MLRALIVNRIEYAGLFPKSCTFMVHNQSLSLPPLNDHSVPFIELRQSLSSRVAARFSNRRSTHALHSEVSKCGMKRDRHRDGSPRSHCECRNPRQRGELLQARLRRLPLLHGRRSLDHGPGRGIRVRQRGSCESHDSRKPAVHARSRNLSHI